MRQYDISRFQYLKEYPIYLLPYGDILVTVIIQDGKLKFLKKTLFPSNGEFAISKNGLVVCSAREYETIMIGKLNYNGECSDYQTISYRSIQPKSLISKDEDIIIGSNLLTFELEERNKILKNGNSWIQLNEHIFIVHTKGFFINDSDKLIEFHNDISQEYPYGEKNRTVWINQWTFDNSNFPDYLNEPLAFELEYQANDASINNNFIAILNLKKKFNSNHYACISILPKNQKVENNISRRYLLKMLKSNQDSERLNSPWNNLLLLPDKNVLLISSNEDGIGIYTFNENNLNQLISELDVLSENDEKKVVEETSNSIIYYNKWNKNIKRIFLPPNDTNSIVVELNTANKINSYSLVSINEILGINEEIDNKDETEQISSENTDENYEEDLSEYSGSWARDVEGLSDDFIDDVLDGDPDAYWNID